MRIRNPHRGIRASFDSMLRDISKLERTLRKKPQPLSSASHIEKVQPIRLGSGFADKAATGQVQISASPTAGVGQERTFHFYGASTTALYFDLPHNIIIQSLYSILINFLRRRSCELAGVMEQPGAAGMDEAAQVPATLRKVMKHQINRRSFLKWSAGAGGALAASGVLQNGLVSTAKAFTAGAEGNTTSSYAPPDMVVTTDWLAEHMGDSGIRIVEVSSMGESTYPEGHIPGAIYWPWKESLWDQYTREFVLPPDFAALMSRSGVTPDTTVIFYSDRCQFGTYALWTCLLRGHINVKIVDGSRTRWVEDGRPMTTAVPEIKPTDYPVQPTNEARRISRNGVLAGMGNPDRVILDGRTPEEYDGLRVKPFPGFDHGAVRKGHIPGAKHLFYRELINEDETWKPVDEIRKAFEARGATPDKDIVSYCRTGHRASFLWFTAYFLLGYPRVRVYDGSWLEWGNMVGMPIEKA